jgi:PKHD-type hydroxylase
MAHQAVWYHSNLPKEIIDLIEKDLSVNFDSSMKESDLSGGVVNKKIRNSSNAWIPTTHWVAGFLWHYVTKANRDNFLYDLDCIDAESLQYTRYESGQFYNWHHDANIDSFYKPENVNGSSVSQEGANDFVNKNIERIRKLSIVVQLSDPYDYEGGNLEMMDSNNQKFVVPRNKGTIILFDSRTPHRVTKVRSGLRKSIVGWAIGPRWR